MDKAQLIEIAKQIADAEANIINENLLEDTV
jgi:hypothetical protein